MAHYIYAYASDAEDLDSLGLVGSLMPTKCEHEEIAGGASELTIEHPYDECGKWKALVKGAIIKADVPVRTVPEINMSNQAAPTRVTSVEQWTVKATATKAQRGLYRKRTGSAKKKTLTAGTRVVVVDKPASGRYKVQAMRARYVATLRVGGMQELRTVYVVETTGYMSPNGLEYESTEQIDDSNSGIEAIAPAWEVREQLFRIYDYKLGDEGVTAYASHISYDLLGDNTTYSNTGVVAAGTALTGIMTGRTGYDAEDDDFSVYTDSANTRAGVDWTRVGVIEALLDPETGFLARWGLELVRDDYDLFFLSKAGFDRGVRIEYGKNLKGVKCEDTDENVITRIIPVGQTSKGKQLLLTPGTYAIGDRSYTVPEGAYWVDSPHISDYPVPHVTTEDVEDAKVGGSVTTALARRRMVEYCLDRFANDEIDMPELSIEVEFVNLGDTVEYAQYRGLENVYLCDTVTVWHPKLGSEIKAKCSGVIFDCLLGRAVKVTLGRLKDKLPKVSTYQLPAKISGKMIGMGTLSGAAIIGKSITDDEVAEETLTVERVESNGVVSITPETGMTLKQTAIGTEMRATEDELGFYRGTTRFAGIGVDGDEGYLAATRLEPADGASRYHWKFEAETREIAESEVYDYGFKFYNGSTCLGKIMSALAWKNLETGTTYQEPGPWGELRIDGTGTNVSITGNGGYSEFNAEKPEACGSALNLANDKTSGTSMDFHYYGSSGTDDVSGHVIVNSECTEISYYTGTEPERTYLRICPDVITGSYTDYTSVIEVGGYSFRPYASSCMNLGGTNYRWRIIFANANLNVSDRRVKCDIVDIELTDAERFILALRPRKFRMIDDGQTGKVHEGFVAQEVAEILPDTGREAFAGYYDENPDTLFLDYAQFVAPLVATVQAQHKRIEEQDKRIAALEAAMERLMGSKKEG